MFSNAASGRGPSEGKSVYERVLGGDFAALDPRLRTYFGSIPEGFVGIGSGIYRSAGLRFRALRPVFAVLGWRRIAFAEYGEEVPFTVRNVVRPDGTLVSAPPADQATEVQTSPSAGPVLDAPSETTDTSDDPAASPTVEPGVYEDYEDGIIEQTEGAKVLFFHATWCTQCRKLDDQLRADGAPDGLSIFKVDYDSRTDLRQKYGVTLQTTVVFVDDAGELLSSTVLYDDPSIESLVAAAP